jgi:hypothetical protein
MRRAFLSVRFMPSLYAYCNISESNRRAFLKLWRSHAIVLVLGRREAGLRWSAHGLVRRDVGLSPFASVHALTVYNPIVYCRPSRCCRLWENHTISSKARWIC